MKIPSIIVDLDGTLVDNRDRMVELYKKTDLSGIDWDRWNEESRHDGYTEWCMNIVKAMSAQGYYILFLTGRSDSPFSKLITKEWLKKHIPEGIKYSLIMRPADDERDDHIAKKEILSDDILSNYDVLFAIDDKESNCDMFRSLGITALLCTKY